MITIVGNILDSSGYSIHTRNLFNALSKKTDVKLITQVFPGTEKLLSDKELEAIKKPDKFDVGLIITTPQHWKLYLNYKRNWVFLVFEGDKIPKSWLDECLNSDIEYILVPSNHTKDAILNTINEVLEGERNSLGATIINKYMLYQTTPGIMEIRAIERVIKEKIKVIPHGVDLNLFYPKEKPKDKFRFLINKGFRHLEDRGGAQYAIKAYLEEFTLKDNVELIFKINPAYGIPDIKQLLHELKPANEDYAPIKITADNLPYNIMVNLYNQSHCLVAPCRADAFNIPCLEAFACGLPVITTSFGGQSEYVNNENGWIVNGELTEVKHELLYEGIKWITPSIPELRKAMREAYFQWEREPFNNKINNALETSKKHTWDATADMIFLLL